MCGGENGPAADHRSATIENVRTAVRGFQEKRDHPGKFGEVSFPGVNRIRLRCKNHRLSLEHINSDHADDANVQQIYIRGA